MTPGVEIFCTRRTGDLVPPITSYTDSVAFVTVLKVNSHKLQCMKQKTKYTTFNLQKKKKNLIIYSFFEDNVKTYKFHGLVHNKIFSSATVLLCKITFFYLFLSEWWKIPTGLAVCLWLVKSRFFVILIYIFGGPLCHFQGHVLESSKLVYISIYYLAFHLSNLIFKPPPVISLLQNKLYLKCLEINRI